MSAKPVKISFVSDAAATLGADLNKAGGELDGFAADAQNAGNKAEAALAGVGDKADAVGGATSQAAGGLGDLGGALSLMPGPLGAVGGGMEALAPAVMGVTGAADLLNLATTKFPILAKAQTLATNTLAGAQKALNLVMAGNPFALVVLAIVALVAIMVVLFKKNEAFHDLVVKVFGVFTGLIGGAVDVLGGFLATTTTALKGAGDKFGDLRDAAGNAIGTYSAKGGGVLGKVFDVVDAVTSLPGKVTSAASGLFSPVLTAAGNAIGTYSAGSDGVLGKLYNVVDTVGSLGGKITNKAAGMWDGISGAFKSTINLMIGWWNNLSFSVDIPDKIPGLPDSFTISTPNIPYLADGGIVTRATLAVIGEAGPEAVVPLDRLGGGGINVEISGGTFVGATRAQVGRWVADALGAYVQGGGARPW
jgi:hypothetical protein